MNETNPIDIVLSVIDPEFPKRIDISKICSNKYLMRKAIDLADRNGLYYYFIKNLNDLGLENSIYQDNRWDIETNNLIGFKKTLDILEIMHKDHNIEYVVIKACTKIAHIPRDVDIYVRKNDIPDIIKILEAMGFMCTHSDSVDTSLTNGSNMKIDIYTGLCYFTGDFIGDDLLWNSRIYDAVQDSKFVSLNDGANLLVLFIHSLFGHRSISLLDFLHLNYIINNTSDLTSYRSYAYKRGWGYSFDAMLELIKRLRDDLYKKDMQLKFPYLFNRSFVIDCVSKMDCLNMTVTNKLFLELSLFQDLIVNQSKDSGLYDVLRSCELTRKTCNSIGYYIRNMRGDKRSGL